MTNIRDDRLPFKVVRGTEDKIMSQKCQEGYIYFATDTKKIYFDFRILTKIY